MRIISTVRDRIKALRYVISVRARERYNTIDNPWFRQVTETVRHIKRDDVTLMAAGVAYYAVLSLFPLTLMLLSVLRLFADSESARENLENFFSAYLPDSVGFVDQISGQDVGISSLAGIIGFFGLLWGGTAMISAMARSINRAFGIKEDRPFYKSRPRAVLLGLAIITAFAASLFGSTAIETVSQFSVPVIGQLTWVQLFARVLPFILTFVTFALIYKVLPHTTTRWNNVLPAAIVAAVLFELAKVLFLIYVNRFASFEIYGAMTLLVILLVWSYFSALVVLIGAEVVAVRREMDAENAARGEDTAEP